MSSNTLRGIGQEGEGEGEGRGPDGRPDGRADLVGEQTQDQPAGDAGNLPDRFQQLRNIRSLDSTVPGTRSLDSSVPDLEPSLDAKVPSLAATLMGVPAPFIPGREQGTVQGRDVHLPVEIQRVAGMRAVAGSYETIPASVERSEPTLRDTVPTGAPESAGEYIHGHAHPHADLNSHAPWYDQEPAGGDVYDDQKPNILGRLAIGAAVAAALSVVLFAAVRLRGQDAAADQSDTTTATPPRPIFSTPEPEALPAPPPPGASAQVPTLDPPADSKPSAAAPTPLPDAKPAAPSPIVTRPMRTIAPAQGTPQAVRAAWTQRPRTTIGQSAGALATAAAPTTKATAQPDPPAPAPALPQAPPQPTAEAEPPTSSTSSPAPKHAAPEKSRTKPAYDPDSTLPLNVD